ncbi:hypothetical protein HK102_011418 [Quaeritorhiza haematococci]|nr:hypothetical protein HK102_011418 [Quaeritorhiza haematococci]
MLGTEPTPNSLPLTTDIPPSVPSTSSLKRPVKELPANSELTPHDQALTISTLHVVNPSEPEEESEPTESVIGNDNSSLDSDTTDVPFQLINNDAFDHSEHTASGGEISPETPPRLDAPTPLFGSYRARQFRTNTPPEGASTTTDPTSTVAVTLQFNSGSTSASSSRSSSPTRVPSFVPPPRLTTKAIRIPPRKASYVHAQQAHAAAVAAGISPSSSPSSSSSVSSGSSGGLSQWKAQVPMGAGGAVGRNVEVVERGVFKFEQQAPIGSGGAGGGSTSDPSTNPSSSSNLKAGSGRKIADYYRHGNGSSGGGGGKSKLTQIFVGWGSRKNAVGSTPAAAAGPGEISFPHSMEGNTTADKGKHNQTNLSRSATIAVHGDNMLTTGGVDVGIRDEVGDLIISKYGLPPHDTTPTAATLSHHHSHSKSATLNRHRHILIKKHSLRNSLDETSARGVLAESTASSSTGTPRVLWEKDGGQGQRFSVESLGAGSSASVSGSGSGSGISTLRMEGFSGTLTRGLQAGITSVMPSKFKRLFAPVGGQGQGHEGHEGHMLKDSEPTPTDAPKLSMPNLDLPFNLNTLLSAMSPDLAEFLSPTALSSTAASSHPTALANLQSSLINLLAAEAEEEGLTQDPAPYDPPSSVAFLHGMSVNTVDNTDAVILPLLEHGRPVSSMINKDHRTTIIVKASPKYGVHGGSEGGVVGEAVQVEIVGRAEEKESKIASEIAEIEKDSKSEAVEQERSSQNSGDKKRQEAKHSAYTPGHRRKGSNLKIEIAPSLICTSTLTSANPGATPANTPFVVDKPSVVSFNVSLQEPHHDINYLSEQTEEKEGMEDTEDNTCSGRRSPLSTSPPAPRAPPCSPSSADADWHRRRSISLPNLPTMVTMNLAIEKLRQTLEARTSQEKTPGNIGGVEAHISSTSTSGLAIAVPGFEQASSPVYPPFSPLFLDSPLIHFSHLAPTPVTTPLNSPISPFQWPLVPPLVVPSTGDAPTATGHDGAGEIHPRVVDLASQIQAGAISFHHRREVSAPNLKFGGSGRVERGRFGGLMRTLTEYQPTMRVTSPYVNVTSGPVSPHQQQHHEGQESEGAVSGVQGMDAVHELDAPHVDEGEEEKIVGMKSSELQRRRTCHVYYRPGRNLKQGQGQRQRQEGQWRGPGVEVGVVPEVNEGPVPAV